MSSVYKILREIEKTNVFDSLDPYKIPSVWPTLTEKERSLLIELILKQGASFITLDSTKTISCFELAAQLAEHSPSIYLHQGLILSNHSDNLECLKLASDAYTIALEKDPQFIPALIEGAFVLMQLGSIHQDADYLSEAVKNLHRALQLIKDEGQALIHWRLGIIHFCIGKLSEEPSDFFQALKHYRWAEEMESEDLSNNADFWIDYGNTLIELASLQNSVELYNEAFAVFIQADRCNGSSSDIHYYLGYILFHLATIQSNEDLFLKACNMLEKTSKIIPDDGRVWWMFGNAELSLGKLSGNVSYIEKSIQKFERAYAIHPEKSIILALWADAEILIGKSRHSIESLQSARKKTVRLVELDSDRAEAWFLYGRCLNEIGYYFEDIQYHEEAIKKLEVGLKLSPKTLVVWYEKALAHFNIAEIMEDLLHLQQSLDCFSKASEFIDGHFFQFYNDWGVALMKWGEASGDVEFIFTAMKMMEKIVKGMSQENFLENIEWAFNYSYGLYLLAQYTEDKHYLEQAIELMSHIVEINPNFFKARYVLALALGDLAELEEDVGLFEKSVGHFRYLLKFDSEKDSALIDGAIALMSLALLKQDLNDLQDVSNNFQEAENLLLSAFKEGDNEASYYLAQLYSLLDQNEAALYYLEKSLQSGSLPPKEELMNNDWLEGFRDSSYFDSFISKIK
jgi:tetratricopeptide (TPR) repeat protein